MKDHLLKKEPLEFMRNLKLLVSQLQLILDMSGLNQGKKLAIISDEQAKKINASRDIIENLSKSSEVIYGVNTGFGALCNTIISEDESNQLQENLLRSHAVGVGKDIPALVAKIMMVLKIHSLCLGFSGVRLEVIQ